MDYSESSMGSLARMPCITENISHFFLRKIFWGRLEIALLLQKNQVVDKHEAIKTSEGAKNADILTYWDKIVSHLLLIDVPLPGKVAPYWSNC